MIVSFKTIALGATFKKDKTLFCKTSSRTARLVEYPSHKVFYFSKTELISYKSVNAPFFTEYR
jgi:hypothetical protein